MRDYGGDVVSFVGVDNVLVGEGIIEWYGKYLKGKPSKVIIIYRDSWRGFFNRSRKRG